MFECLNEHQQVIINSSDVCNKLTLESYFDDIKYENLHSEYIITIKDKVLKSLDTTKIHLIFVNDVILLYLVFFDSANANKLFEIDLNIKVSHYNFEFKEDILKIILYFNDSREEKLKEQFEKNIKIIYQKSLFKIIYANILQNQLIQNADFIYIRKTKHKVLDGWKVFYLNSFKKKILNFKKVKFIKKISFKDFKENIKEIKNSKIETKLTHLVRVRSFKEKLFFAMIALKMIKKKEMKSFYFEKIKNFQIFRNNLIRRKYLSKLRIVCQKLCLSTNYKNLSMNLFTYYYKKKIFLTLKKFFFENTKNTHNNIDKFTINFRQKVFNKFISNLRIRVKQTKNIQNYNSLNILFLKSFINPNDSARLELNTGCNCDKFSQIKNKFKTETYITPIKNLFNVMKNNYYKNLLIANKFARLVMRKYSSFNYSKKFQLRKFAEIKSYFRKKTLSREFTKFVVRSISNQQISDKIQMLKDFFRLRNINQNLERLRDYALSNSNNKIIQAKHDFFRYSVKSKFLAFINNLKMKRNNMLRVSWKKFFNNSIDMYSNFKLKLQLFYIIKKLKENIWRKMKNRQCANNIKIIKNRNILNFLNLSKKGFTIRLKLNELKNSKIKTFFNTLKDKIKTKLLFTNSRKKYIKLVSKTVMAKLQLNCLKNISTKYKLNSLKSNYKVILTKNLLKISNICLHIQNKLTNFIKSSSKKVKIRFFKTIKKFLIKKILIKKINRSTKITLFKLIQQGMKFQENLFQNKAEFINSLRSRYLQKLKAEASNSTKMETTIATRSSNCNLYLKKSKLFLLKKEFAHLKKSLNCDKKYSYLKRKFITTILLSKTKVLLQSKIKNSNLKKKIFYRILFGKFNLIKNNLNCRNKVTERFKKFLILSFLRNVNKVIEMKKIEKGIYVIKSFIIKNIFEDFKLVIQQMERIKQIRRKCKQAKIKLFLAHLKEHIENKKDFNVTIKKFKCKYFLKNFLNCIIYSIVKSSLNNKIRKFVLKNHLKKFKSNSAPLKKYSNKKLKFKCTAKYFALLKDLKRVNRVRKHKNSIKLYKLNLIKSFFVKLKTAISNNKIKRFRNSRDAARFFKLAKLALHKEKINKLQLYYLKKSVIKNYQKFKKVIFTKNVFNKIKNPFICKSKQNKLKESLYKLKSIENSNKKKTFNDLSSKTNIRNLVFKNLLTLVKNKVKTKQEYNAKLGKMKLCLVRFNKINFIKKLIKHNSVSFDKLIKLKALKKLKSNIRASKEKKIIQIKRKTLLSKLCLFKFESQLKASKKNNSKLGNKAKMINSNIKKRNLLRFITLTKSKATYTKLKKTKIILSLLKLKNNFLKFKQLTNYKITIKKKKQQSKKMELFNILKTYWTYKKKIYKYLNTK